MLERVVEVPATVVPMSELGIYYYNTEWKILILKRTNIGHRVLWRITVHDAGTTWLRKKIPSPIHGTIWLATRAVFPLCCCVS
jgi:hypothetical protein